VEKQVVVVLRKVLVKDLVRNLAPVVKLVKNQKFVTALAIVAVKGSHQDAQKDLNPEKDLTRNPLRNPARNLANLEKSVVEKLDVAVKNK
jgi:hypothetical protein